MFGFICPRPEDQPLLEMEPLQPFPTEGSLPSHASLQKSQIDKSSSGHTVMGPSQHTWQMPPPTSTPIPQGSSTTRMLLKLPTCPIPVGIVTSPTFNHMSLSNPQHLPFQQQRPSHFWWDNAVFAGRAPSWRTLLGWRTMVVKSPPVLGTVRPLHKYWLQF